MDDLISREAAVWIISDMHGLCRDDVLRECIQAIKELPAVDAIPVEWLNERHRKCCEEGDTDLTDAITVLCNEYHVWQKEQEAQDG